MDDKEIIRLYLSRNEDAIAATAEKFGGYCRSIAGNILHNEEDVKECINDVYLSAWSSIPPRIPERLGAFLGKITRNAALSRRRRAAAKKRGAGQLELALSELSDCVPTALGVEQGAEEGEISRCIENFLRALPKDKRQVFVKRYWYLCPVGEIAREYGMSVAKVKSMLFRTRKDLKKALNKEGIEL